jgi:hypothetical protein
MAVICRLGKGAFQTIILLPFLVGKVGLQYQLALCKVSDFKDFLI